MKVSVPTVNETAQQAVENLVSLPSFVHILVFNDVQEESCMILYIELLAIQSQ